MMQAAISHDAQLTKKGREGKEVVKFDKENKNIFIKKNRKKSYFNLEVSSRLKFL